MVQPDLGLASVPVLDQVQLPRSCQTFKCRNGNKEQTIYIVGTCHVSAASCDDVRAVIRAVKPEVVMLELCQERVQLLTMEKQDALTLSQAFAVWRSGNATTFQAAYSYLLGQLGDALEVMPGEEFRVALQEAVKVDAKVLLGDRRLHITLARVWASLSSWQKVKLVWMFIHSGLTLSKLKEDLAEEIESTKETDAMTAVIKEVGLEFPALLEPLMYERDLYMVKQLRSLQKCTRLVAVVGAGHLPGMREHWDDTIDLEEICRIPENTPSRIQWGRLVITILGTGSLFYYGTMLRRQ